MNYLTEAFKALSLINEDAVRIYDNDGIRELQEIVNAEVEPEVKVIDIDAETEDDIKNTYVGKILLQCPVCKSIRYADIDGLTFSAEDDEEPIENRLVNRDEECPYCATTNGFAIMGKVAPYEEPGMKVDYTVEEEATEEEPAEEEVEEETAEEEVAEEETIEEAVEEEAPAEDAVEEAEEITEDVEEQAEEVEEEEVNESLETRVYYPEVEEACEESAEEREELTEASDEICEKCEEELTEGFNNIDISTDDERLTMEQDAETKKVTVTTEPIDKSGFDFEAPENGDMVAPLTDTDVENLEGESDEQAEEAAEEVAEEEPAEEAEGEEAVEEGEEEPVEEEEDFEEFDEGAFDELGESYLKNSYDNVESYITESVSKQRGSKSFIVEGKIKFASGKVGKTQFMFEAKSTHGNRIVFEGVNNQITGSNKAYRLTCNLDGKTLHANKMAYRYTDADNNTLRGMVSNKK